MIGLTVSDPKESESWESIAEDVVDRLERHVPATVVQWEDGSYDVYATGILNDISFTPGYEYSIFQHFDSADDVLNGYSADDEHEALLQGVAFWLSQVDHVDHD